MFIVARSVCRAREVCSPGGARRGASLPGVIETCPPVAGRLAGTAVLLALVVAACGGGGGDDAATANTGGAVTSQAAGTGSAGTEAGDSKGEPGDTTATPPDPCGLVTDEAASALVGQDVTGVPAPVNGAPYAVCQWGELFKGNVLSVQVAGQKDTVRPLQLLVSASTNTAQPSSVGTDGKYIPDIGYVYGGGGVGQSVIFRHGEWDVLVGLTGEDGPSQAELEAVAADIDAAMS